MNLAENVRKIMCVCVCVYIYIYIYIYNSKIFRISPKTCKSELNPGKNQREILER